MKNIYLFLISLFFLASCGPDDKVQSHSNNNNNAESISGHPLADKIKSEDSFIASQYSQEQPVAEYTGSFIAELENALAQFSDADKSKYSEDYERFNNYLNFMNVFYQFIILENEIFQDTGFKIVGSLSIEQRSKLEKLDVENNITRITELRNIYEKSEKFMDKDFPWPKIKSELSKRSELIIITRTSRILENKNISLWNLIQPYIVLNNDDKSSYQNYQNLIRLHKKFIPICQQDDSQKTDDSETKINYKEQKQRLNIDSFYFHIKSYLNNTEDTKAFNKAKEKSTTCSIDIDFQNDFICYVPSSNTTIVFEKDECKTVLNIFKFIEESDAFLLKTGLNINKNMDMDNKNIFKDPQSDREFLLSHAIEDSKRILELSKYFNSLNESNHQTLKNILGIIKERVAFIRKGKAYFEFAHKELRRNDISFQIFALRDFSSQWSFDCSAPPNPKLKLKSACKFFKDFLKGKECTVITLQKAHRTWTKETHPDKFPEQRECYEKQTAHGNNLYAEAKDAKAKEKEGIFRSRQERELNEDLILRHFGTKFNP